MDREEQNVPYTPPNPFGIDPAYWAVIQNLRLLDDTLMCAALDDNPEAVQLILRIILEKPDLIVTSVRVQREYKNLYGHSVRLDVEATDSEGKLYNIEIQRGKEGAGPERARYNSALIDTHALRKRKKAKDLPETYVVFITEKDFWKAGLPVYHIDRIIQETGQPFGDRAHIVYANGAYHGDTDMGRLMADFRSHDPEKMYYSALADRIRHLKYSEEGVKNMCRAEELLVQAEARKARRKGRQEGRQEGMKKATTQTMDKALRNLMATTHWSLDQAMAALNIPPEEQPSYRERLEKADQEA